MELVRYRPGEAIRWLRTGAKNMRKSAGQRTMGIVRQADVDQKAGPGQKGFGDNVRSAAGALYDFGKSAYADVVHRQAEGVEYVLQDDHFDVVRGGAIQTIPYRRVQKVRSVGDKVKIQLEKGAITVKPVAYIVAGRVRVPVGWSRNGIEVPYDLLGEELAARCGLDVEEAA